jgi:uncharacterized protein (TIGR02301 family)
MGMNMGIFQNTDILKCRLHKTASSIIASIIASICFFLVIQTVPSIAQTNLELEIEQYDFEHGIFDTPPDGNTSSTKGVGEDAPDRYDDTPLTNVPYEKEILRLSQILGAMHYLNKICPANVNKNWRGSMGNIINNERASGKYRGKLTAYYNRGFKAYQITYKTCTDNAKHVINQYTNEGAELAKSIIIRYGRQ